MTANWLVSISYSSHELRRLWLGLDGDVGTTCTLGNWSSAIEDARSDSVPL